MCPLSEKINLASSPLDDQPGTVLKSPRLPSWNTLHSRRCLEVGNNMIPIHAKRIYPALLP